MKDLHVHLHKLRTVVSNHQRHAFCARLCKEHLNDVFVSAAWALRKECATCPAVKKSDPMMLVPVMKPLIVKVCDAVLGLLRDDGNQSPNLLDSESEDEDPITLELESMKGMAEVINHETRHFAKHHVCAWW